MKPLKTGLVVLFLTIALFIFYGGFKILFFGNNSNQNSNSLPQKSNSTAGSIGELKIRAPIQWIKDNQILSQPQKLESASPDISSSDNSYIQGIIGELQNLKWQDIGFVSTSQDKATEKAISSESLDDYLTKVLGVWAKNSFTGEEFASIKKNKDGRVLSLEELIQEAIQGGNSEELKLSFRAWQVLDERTVNDLKNISVSSQLLSSHQSMISWFQYHSQVAGKLSKENLSGGEINNLFNQYSEKAKVETPKFQQALAPVKKAFGSIFIPKAQAQTESSFYHFGGLVVSYADFCTNGFAVVITGVKGGLLWIYYPAFIANPYVYRMLVPSYYDLGRALWGPGTCNKGKVNYPLGIAQILFFGSSATPL